MPPVYWPVTKSPAQVDRLVVRIAKLPPVIAAGPADPSGSWTTRVSQTATSATPRPEPANWPTVDVKAYSNPLTANVVDAGAALAVAEAARAVTITSRTSKARIFMSVLQESL